MVRLSTRLSTFPPHISPATPYQRANTLPKLVGGFGLGALVAAALVSGATAGDLAAQSSPPEIIQLTNTALGEFPSIRTRPTIRRDGSAVAFLMAHTEYDVRLYVARGDGAGPQQVTPTGSFLRAADLPAFGTKLVFVACENSTPCARSNLGAPGDIYVVGVDGRGRTRLTFDNPQLETFGPFYEQAIISADGTKVAFTTSFIHPTEFRRFMTLFVINADGTGRQELVLPTSSLPTDIIPLSFSRDGSEIAFVYDDSSEVNISAIRTDGSGFRILTNAPQGDSVPCTLTRCTAALALSGDWTTLAYVDPGGLKVVKTDGTGFAVLDTTLSVQPTITFDGSLIAYLRLVAYQRLDVFLINADGTNQRNLTNVPLEGGGAGDQLFTALEPSISDLGLSVAFRSNTDLDIGQNTDLNFEVFLALLGPTLPAPTVTSITPDSGPVDGGTSVTITGTAFAAGATITLGGSPATGVTVVDSTTMTAVTPPHAAGVVDVLVTNLDGLSGGRTDGFAYVAPPPTFCVTGSVSPAGAGVVSLSPVGPCYAPGTPVQLTATADAGYVFAYWSEDVSVATNPTTVSVSQNLSVTAVFSRLPALRGRVGIWDGTEFWPLDGRGITSITVTVQGGGYSETVDATGASFAFSSLAPGAYTLIAAIQYDEVMPDTTQPCGLVSIGTPVFLAPKTATAVGRLDLTGEGVEVELRLPRPLVFVHGIRSDYRKWYEGSDTAITWDDWARRNGTMTLTPNYKSNTGGVWNESVSNVSTHVNNYLRQWSTRASIGGLPRWNVVAHSQGGLVVRALLWTGSVSNSTKTSLGKIFLLGTPNSGATTKALAAMLCADYLDPKTIMRSFNTSPDKGGAPTFAGKEVLGFAGTFGKLLCGGAFGKSLGDLVVCSESVHQILTPQGLNEQIPAVPGKSWLYDHLDLGSPATLGAILVNEIMPRQGAPTVVVVSPAPAMP